MNNQKNSFRKNQLNSNSTLFLQLGIILSLIIVYCFFELEFSRQRVQLPVKSISEEKAVLVISEFKIEEKVIEKKKSFKKPIELTTILTEKDPIRNEKPILLEPEETPQDPYMTHLDGIEEVITEEEDDIIPIGAVEQAPRFPGCNGPTEAEYKQCLNKKIMAFISKNFNPRLNIGRDHHGPQKIQVQFEIDKNGQVSNIKARSAHMKLEKEAKRVIAKLPNMIPGKQYEKNVSVKYYLPISFYIK